MTHSILKVACQGQLGTFDIQLDLEILAAGVTVVFGPSGSGKSTLLRTLAGLQRFPDAYIQFHDQIWQKAKLCVPPHRRRIGYVFQDPSLFEHLDVAGNLNYARKRAASATTADSMAFKSRFDHCLASLDLEDLMSRQVATLSGGQKQRVVIARALLSQPQLLLMDEPVSALDIPSKQQILGSLRRLVEELEIPLIYVTHSLDEVAQLADRVVLMDAGRVLEQGPVADLLLSPKLRRMSNSGAETLLEVEVVELDDDYGLARLRFAGGDLWVTNRQLNINDRTRVRLLARDLSIALEPPGQSSIQNRLRATVVSIDRDLHGQGQETDGQAMVELDAGGHRLLAQITRKSADELSLEPGLNVYIQIKSVALLN